MQRLISRLLPVLAAAAMAFTATAHAATSQNQDLQLIGSDATGYSAAASATHSEAGSFLDTFKFNAASTSLVEITLITIGAGDDQLISFTNAWLNGTPLTFTSTAYDDGTILTMSNLSVDSLVGDLVLTVQGYAGGSLAAGSDISASYSATFNVIPSVASAVPEPQSAALFLAGLGAMGLLVVRRRKA